LANPTTPGQSKTVKLGKAGYWIRLLDLYKSNAFGPDIAFVWNDFQIPEPWCVVHTHCSRPLEDILTIRPGFRKK
jgi:hypothetical protein